MSVTPLCLVTYRNRQTATLTVVLAKLMEGVTGDCSKEASER
jgi:hypothetical protein